MMLWICILLISVLLVQFPSCSNAFTPSSTHKRLLRLPTIAVEKPQSVLYMGKSRKARRTQKVEKQGKSRPEGFFDAINDAAGKDPKKSSPPPNKAVGGDGVGPKNEDEEDEKARREAMKTEAQKRMDERPDISTMIVDEETGIEVVAQGKAVMDVVSRKAVILSGAGPDARLAQMFPGVPPETREKYRFDWTTITVPQMIDALIDASSVRLEDGKMGIPPHPSVANKAIDFVIANRDYLGYKMKRTLGKLTMRSMSSGQKDEAREYKKLWKHFLTLENHISAPFRQMIMDGEGRVGPQFGNLDLMSYCNGPLYERIANYIVLKGMVAHWEKKVRDADYIEKTPQTKDNYISVLSRGDPKRYLPDPPILFTLRECTQVCLMSQQMCKAFVETPELFADFPPEVRFLEQSLVIKGGTALRQFMIQDFCPAEGITPEALREGMRRLYTQLENMQLDPYGDITNIVERLIAAMSVGTDDERDPYKPYLSDLSTNSPGFFQTYTFDHDQLSLVRFFDSRYERSGSGKSGGGGKPSENPLGNFFNFGKDQQQQPVKNVVKNKSETYKVPAVRAIGRPHNVGWLEMLDDEKEDKMRLGRVPAGRIIPDEE